MEIHKIAQLGVLAATLNGCNCSGDTTSAPELDENRFEVSEQIEAVKDFDEEQFEKAYEENGFSGLAPLLRPYRENMNEANQKRFDAVLARLENNLDGLNVERSAELSKKDSSEDTQRAMTSYHRMQDPSLPVTVSLSEEWTAGSAMDLIHLVHELNHANEVQDAVVNLTPFEWSVLYAAPGNALEIRFELGAWDLTLALADQMSEGALGDFFQEALSARSQQEADIVLEKYVEIVGDKLNVEANRRGQLKKWLMLNFMLERSEKMDGLDCRWGYGFVTEIAGMYKGSGVDIYEVTNANPGADSQRCVYPLDGGPYESAWVYGQMSNGMFGPTEKIEFNRPAQ